MTGELWVGPREAPETIRLGPAVSAGGEGVVYRGEMIFDDREVSVAVKMLLPAHLPELSQWSASWLAQVEVLRSAVVPGMVAVRDAFLGPLPHRAGESEGATATLYVVMDWIDGVPLDRWLRGVHATEPEQLLLSIVPVAAALDLLHSGAATGGTPVIHGDIKPSNILMRPSGDTVLVDVGSVQALGSGASRPNVVFGTRGYVSPEARVSQRFTPASDRFAFGAVAFFLLTGNEPPLDATASELRDALSAAPLVADRTDLVDHVMAMLDTNPDSRPTSLANWVAQLRRSSLVALPGDVALPPLASGRHDSRSGRTQDAFRASRGRRARRLVYAAGAAALATALFLTLGPVGIFEKPTHVRSLSSASNTTQHSATTLLSENRYYVDYQAKGEATFPIKPTDAYVYDLAEGARDGDLIGPKKFSVKLISTTMQRQGRLDGEYAPPGNAYLHFTIRITALKGDVHIDSLKQLVLGLSRDAELSDNCDRPIAGNYCPIEITSADYDTDPAIRASAAGAGIPEGHWAEYGLVPGEDTGGYPISLPPSAYAVFFRDAHGTLHPLSVQRPLGN